MKIRFIQTLSTSRECFRRGKEYDLDGAEAAEYLAKGLAVEADAPQPPTVEVPATAPKKTRQKKTPKGE